jgi:uncharacterized membrane protein
MLEILFEYKINILLSLLFLIALVSILFPLENLISKNLKMKVGKNHILFSVLALVLLILALTTKIEFVLNFIAIPLSLTVFLIGFLSDRKYIYTLALISLSLTPIMLIVKLDSIAEFFAQTCYLLLVLGVLRDIFYEKIFK